MTYHETINGHQVENRAGSYKCMRCGLTALTKKQFERDLCEQAEDAELEFP